jgi:hypothetical protein
MLIRSPKWANSVVIWTGRAIFCILGFGIIKYLFPVKVYHFAFFCNCISPRLSPGGKNQSSKLSPALFASAGHDCFKEAAVIK